MLAGIVRTDAGSVELDGKDLKRLSAQERAKRIAYLPQHRPLAWPVKVRDVVALGRFAHGAALGRLRESDQLAVDKAIAACDLNHLANRRTDTLSGGEVARVHFARALAGQAPLLLADEPIAALDPRQYLRITQLLREFVDRGGGAVVVLHDVALAARFAHRLVWMHSGKVVVTGSPEETLNEAIMGQVYGVNARIEKDPLGFSVKIDSAR